MIFYRICISFLSLVHFDVCSIRNFQEGVSSLLSPRLTALQMRSSDPRNLPFHDQQLLDQHILNQQFLSSRFSQGTSKQTNKWTMKETNFPQLTTFRSAYFKPAISLHLFTWNKQMNIQANKQMNNEANKQTIHDH